jgi:hypothetical protein
LTFSKLFFHKWLLFFYVMVILTKVVWRYGANSTKKKITNNYHMFCELKKNSSSKFIQSKLLLFHLLLTSYVQCHVNLFVLVCIFFCNICKMLPLIFQRYNSDDFRYEVFTQFENCISKGKTKQINNIDSGLFTIYNNYLFQNAYVNIGIKSWHIN